MGGRLLRALALVCATLLVASETTVYEEDLNKDHVPGLQGHSWTMVDDGEDGPSKFVLHIQTVSTNGGDGSSQALSDLLAQQNSMLEELGYSDEPIALSTANSGAFDWPIPDLSQLQDFHDIIFSTPFVVHTSASGSFFDTPGADDQSPLSSLQQQMLQNVACTRLPALMAANSQDSNTFFWDDSTDADTEGQDWDVEDFLEREEQQFSEQKNYDKTLATTKRVRLWSRVVFITLVFGCSLTLFISIRQGLQLRRAMREASQKASEIAFYGDMVEKQPLLSTFGHKGMEQHGDGYAYVKISPIDSEPAVKPKYPAFP